MLGVPVSAHKYVRDYIGQSSSLEGNSHSGTQ